MLVRGCEAGPSLYYLSGCGWRRAWRWGGVGGEVEELVEAVLDGVHLGGHATGWGPPAGGGVDEDGLLDAGQGGEHFAHAHRVAGLGGLAAHEAGDGEGEDAVEGVDADLLVGPVPHGTEADDVGVFHLAEVAFGFGLGAVGGDRLGVGPVVVVGEED